MDAFKSFNLNELRFELTQLCNLSCSYCFIKNYDALIDLNTIKNTITDSIPLGLEKVSFTGGEPLLVYPSLLELIKFMKSKYLEVGLLTNGTLASTDKIKELSNLGLDWVRVSIDGLESTNDEVRGKGSYKKAVQAVERFKESDIIVRLRPTITKFNVNCIDDLVDLSISLGVDTLEFQHYIPIGDRVKDVHFSLSPEEQLRAANHLLGLKEMHNKNLDIKLLSGWFEFLIDGYEGEPKPYFCGRTFLYVDVEGNIKTCAPNNLVLGNITSQSIKEVFTKSQVLKELREYNASRYCPECKKVEYCQPCPSPIINYFGTLNGPSPNCPDWRQSMDSKVYFDDLEAGDRWISPMREPLSPVDIKEYIALTGERNKMHSKNSFAPGYLLFQNMGALSQLVSARKDGFFNEYNARLLSPVIVGQDRFYLVETVLEKEDKGSRNRGYVLLGRDLIKEDGEVAVEAKIKVQVDKRPDSNAP